ncbi:hypothetical protein MAPG_02631 [Magnaporthiopsis poae ATCC 64411]|uniref:Uncharacterized protein n=1 Tax=Magnaporthiopsis poae (strain ATCC 64411 / 73-15) TaxID=644358 RepID=A0A0C4DRW4_MAGP6|nr:hypothetical protein MAPG_02631 [Magnaporthiopsis poae ATCC 64411]
MCDLSGALGPTLEAFQLHDHCRSPVGRPSSPHDHGLHATPATARSICPVSSISRLSVLCPAPPPSLACEVFVIALQSRTENLAHVSSRPPNAQRDPLALTQLGDWDTTTLFFSLLYGNHGLCQDSGSYLSVLGSTSGIVATSGCRSRWLMTSEATGGGERSPGYRRASHTVALAWSLAYFRKKLRPRGGERDAAKTRNSLL